MTLEQALKINSGDIVTTLGVRCQVHLIRLKPDPWFHLYPVEECSPEKEKQVSGLTNYQLCGVVRDAAQ